MRILFLACRRLPSHCVLTQVFLDACTQRKRGGRTCTYERASSLVSLLKRTLILLDQGHPFPALLWPLASWKACPNFRVDGRCCLQYSRSSGQGQRTSGKGKFKVLKACTVKSQKYQLPLRRELRARKQRQPRKQGPRKWPKFEYNESSKVQESSMEILITSLEASSPNMATLGVRASTYEFGGEHKYSVCNTCLPKKYCAFYHILCNIHNITCSYTLHYIITS